MPHGMEGNVLIPPATTAPGNTKNELAKIYLQHPQQASNLINKSLKKSLPPTGKKSKGTRYSINSIKEQKKPDFVPQGQVVGPSGPSVLD